MRSRTPLLEQLLADTLGHKKVTILDLDISRRLGAATRTHMRLRFEAEPSDESSESQGNPKTIPGKHVLPQVLQQMFEKEGLDLEVQSAIVELEEDSASPASSSETDDFLAFAASAFVGMSVYLGLGFALRLCAPLQKGEQC